MAEGSEIIQRSTWTANKSGELVLTGGHNAEECNINILSDYLIPWYMTNPNLTQQYPERTPGIITFKFQAEGESERSMAMNCHDGALQAYFNKDSCEDKIQKFRIATLNTLKFHPNTGREVLSWIYCSRSCFCSHDDVNNVLKLADQLGIHDLRDAILSNRLNEILPHMSMPVMCTFKSATVEYRPHSNFRLGFHLSQNDYYCIQLSNIPFKGNLIYTITGPNSGKKLAHSFHAFLHYMHTISKNSLNLYQISFPQTDSDIHKSRCNSFLYKPNQFRLQILTKNHVGIKEAIARTREEVVYSFTVEKPGFFFGISDIQPYFTFSSPTYKGLLNFMREYSMDSLGINSPTGYALEIRKPEFCTVQKLMGAVNLMGFYPLDNVLYVVQSDRLGMLNVMEKLEESTEPLQPLPDIKIVEVYEPGPLHVSN